MIKLFQLLKLCVVLLIGGHCNAQDYQLVWSDEFNKDGCLDESIWNYEQGYARNEELQWYQSDNAWCQGGLLVIEARSEKRKNPLYKAGSYDWRTSREYIECTSSSITTFGKKEFLYGRFEVRARIPVGKGAWPAIWTLGSSMEWPSCGEIDIMEFYRKHGASEFHIWRMDWDEEAIRLYLDDELLNEILLKDTYNGSIGSYKNPFMQPQYILLNLAVGGINGGEVEINTYPIRYEIDYVRVYQKK